MLLAIPLLLAQPELLAQQDSRWTRLADLPDPVGVAGPCVGVHRGALIVAGGANFPDGMPWRGGAKHYERRIHVLPAPDEQWLTLERTLPAAIAYPVSVSTDDGVLCIGGRDAERCSATVLRLAWDPDRRDVDLERLPDLPVPLAHAGGARIGSVVYVAGGQSEATGSPGNAFFALDLRESAWRKLPPLPGPRRGLPVVAAAGGALYVFSGRDYGPERPSDEPFAFHADVLRFEPTSDVWSEVGPLRAPGDAAPRCIMAGTAIAVAPSRIFLFGGADGSGMTRIESLAEPAKTEFLEHHPGFPRDVLAFDASTGEFSIRARLPATESMPVTTTAVRFGDAIVLPSGEVSPGRRTPAVLAFRLEDDTAAKSDGGWFSWRIAAIGGVVVVWMCIRTLVKRRSVRVCS